jgi:hypothetical protein
MDSQRSAHDGALRSTTGGAGQAAAAGAKIELF